jgi:hypothetical protein
MVNVLNVELCVAVIPMVKSELAANEEFAETYLASAKKLTIGFGASTVSGPQLVKNIAPTDIRATKDKNLIFFMLDYNFELQI